MAVRQPPEELYGAETPVLPSRPGIGEFYRDLPKTLQRVPRTYLRELESEFHITAEMPGIDEKDVDVSVTGNTLTIRGGRGGEEGGGEPCRDCSSGTFERRVQLPAGADTDRITASYRNGVLHVEVPKSEEHRRGGNNIRVQ